MKKSISAILAAALTLSALTCMPASAEKYGDGKKIVVFGDSIAAAQDGVSTVFVVKVFFFECFADPWHVNVVEVE